MCFFPRPFCLILFLPRWTCFSVAWLCINKFSIVAERDPLFETMLLSSYLRALDQQELSATYDSKVMLHTLTCNIFA